jgi:hypothetical protein
MLRAGVLTSIIVIVSAGSATAQTSSLVPPPRVPPPSPLVVAPDETADEPSSGSERRACDGCPPRRVGRAFLQTTMINVAYELANLIRGQVTARITPKTWWDNMENGWVWDLDDFVVNQIGHPYQGNNYFNAGRANGLSFYESSAMAAFGSATWEYFGETNKPSLNDFINTTLGGIALGEMFHRTAWLIRDPRATGRGRLWREIAATAIDPVTGYNRFTSGDASRLADKPEEFVPSALGAVASAGLLWRGTNTSVFDSAGQPFLEVDVIYGEPETGRSRTPYDAFVVRLTMGGGGGLSEARVRGRLLGEPFAGDRAQFSVVQSYSFQGNDAYHFGAQSIEGTVAVTKKLSPRTSLVLHGWGGLTVLGAVDSLPPGEEGQPEPPVEDESAGQGISEGPRFYDYGPGTTWGGSAMLTRGRRIVTAFVYEGRTLYSLDGVRANHVLQRLRLDLLSPLRGSLGIGATGEFFDRRSYYQDPSATRTKYHYPQIRVYFTWSQS